MSCATDGKAKLIGIAGFKGSGKNAAATAIPDRVELAFADPIKTMLCTGLGLSYHECYDQTLKETPLPEYDGLTPRDLMISLGSGWGRELMPDLWVRAVAKQIDRMVDTGGYVVVTDVRMENEAAMIRARGGTIIHIQRGQPENWWQRLLRRINKPDSEQHLRRLPGDIVIHNDSDLPDLYWRVANALVKQECEGVIHI